MGGNAIPRVNQVRYLGVTLVYKLNWRHHITERVILALGALARVSRTLGSLWGQSPELVIWAYKTPVLPVLRVW